MRPASTPFSSLPYDLVGGVNAGEDPGRPTAAGRWMVLVPGRVPPGLAVVLGLAARLAGAVPGLATVREAAGFGFAAVRGFAAGRALAAGLAFGAVRGFAAGRALAAGFAAGLAFAAVRGLAFARGLTAALARAATVAAGLAADMSLAAAVSALDAVLIALVATFIACRAVDIVFADDVAFVAAEVILVAAEVTFAAAAETVRAAAAGAAELRDAALLAVARDAVLRVRDAVLRDVVLRLPADRVARGAAALAPALDFGWLAGFRAVPRDLAGAVFAGLRRAVLRAVFCAGIDLLPRNDQLRESYSTIGRYLHRMPPELMRLTSPDTPLCAHSAGKCDPVAAPGGLTMLLC